MERSGWAKQPADIEPESLPSGPGDVRMALADGRYGDAARAYFALPAAEARSAVSPDEAVALAQWLRERGHPDAALTLLRRVIHDRPRAAGIAEVNALAGSILLREMGEPTEAYQLLRSALDLSPRPDTGRLIRQELAVIEGLQKRRVGRLHAPPPWAS
jgi:hypothetical protein